MKILILFSLFVLVGLVSVHAQSTYRFENNTPYTFTYQLKGDPFKLGEVVSAPPGIVTGPFNQGVTYPVAWEAVNTTLGCSVNGIITGPTPPTTPPFPCQRPSNMTYEVVNTATPGNFHLTVLFTD